MKPTKHIINGCSGTLPPQYHGMESGGGAYRFGFNGMELTPEVGKGSYTTYFRQMDAKIGRWWSVDPEAASFAHQSPYITMDGNPILLVDPWGNSTGEYEIDLDKKKMTKISDKGDAEGIDYYYVINKDAPNFSASDAGLYDFKIEKSPGEENLNVIRISETKNSTTSVFNLTGTDVAGYMLEPAGPSTTQANQDKRIPEGAYSLENYSSAKYPDVFRLYSKDVAKSRRILIHTGNKPRQTLGCLLTGCSTTTDFVGNSRIKFKELRPAIKKYKAQNVKLNIINIINYNKYHHY